MQWTVVTAGDTTSDRCRSSCDCGSDAVQDVTVLPGTAVLTELTINVYSKMSCISVCTHVMYLCVSTCHVSVRTHISCICLYPHVMYQCVPTCHVLVCSHMSCISVYPHVMYQCVPTCHVSMCSHT